MTVIRDPQEEAVSPVLQNVVLGGTAMATAVGRLTIWSIVAIVVIARLTVNR